MRKIIVLLLISIFLASACAQQKPAGKSEDLIGQGNPVQQQTPSGNNQIEEKIVGEEAASTTQAPTQTPASAEVKEFKMTAKQFSFIPETIEVNKGDKVRLIVTTTDVPHGISIPEYGINERLDPGKPVTIEFTADKEGTFTAFCSVFCGSGHSNMKGNLVVK